MVVYTTLPRLVEIDRTVPDRVNGSCDEHDRKASYVSRAYGHVPCRNFRL